MKLMKLPMGLPIDSIEDVTHLLGTLIATLQDEYVLFTTSDGPSDYQETLSHLNKDLNGYIETYEDWKSQARTQEQKLALDKMLHYIEQADILIAQAAKVSLH